MVLSLNVDLTSQNVKLGVITNRLDKEQDYIATKSDNRRRAFALAFEPFQEIITFNCPALKCNYVNLLASRWHHGPSDPRRLCVKLVPIESYFILNL